MITEVMIKGFRSYSVSPKGVFKLEIKFLSGKNMKSVRFQMLVVLAFVMKVRAGFHKKPCKI